MDFSLQIKRFAFTVVPLMLAAMLVFSNLGGILRIIAFLAAAGLTYLAYLMFLGFYVEWEYTFVTNEVSFAKIMNKSKRKDLTTCLVKDTIVLAKNTDKEHLSRVPSNVKKYAFLSHTGAEYYCWYTKDNKGKNVLIMFEPDQDMLLAIQKLARDRVFA